MIRIKFLKDFRKNPLPKFFRAGDLERIKKGGVYDSALNLEEDFRKCLRLNSGIHNIAESIAD